MAPTQLTAKYRPYLTVQQIRYFLGLAESDTRSETEALRLRSVRELKLFLTRFDLGALQPASISAPRPTVMDKLGLEVASPAELRESSYELWRMNPELCTSEQLRLAKLYMYENDLMSPEEEAEYEATL